MQVGLTAIEFALFAGIRLMSWSVNDWIAGEWSSIVAGGALGLGGWAESGQCVGLKSGGVRRRVGRYIFGYSGEIQLLASCQLRGDAASPKANGRVGGKEGQSPTEWARNAVFWEGRRNKPRMTRHSIANWLVMAAASESWRSP